MGLPEAQILLSHLYASSCRFCTACSGSGLSRCEITGHSRLFCFVAVGEWSMSGHLTHMNSKQMIQISAVVTDKTSSESPQVEQKVA